MIMNQTNYTREEAEVKLAELKDPVTVIRQYLTPSKSELPPKPEDASQMIHKTIRKFMEEAFSQRA